MDDEEIAVVEAFTDDAAEETWQNWFMDDGEFETKVHGGSRPGRKPNKKRDPEQRYRRLVAQYFADEPIYNDTDFRRRFRMSRRLFQRVYDGVCAADPKQFTQRPDATGKMGVHPLLKIVSALRILAYASPADSLDENLEIAESTVNEALRCFLDAVESSFGCEYLRAPTTQDVAQLLSTNARRGFTGMLFSLDCMHWHWQNCPASKAGSYTGKEKKPTVVLEACADHELWIWYASFGWPGSLNDINILDRSDFFDRLLRGETPQVQFTVNGNQYDKAYCLADGIYPNWPVFLKTIAEPTGNKNKHYAQWQEACRKDVERAFGVLQSRWRIISIPSKYWHRKTLGKIMRACIILHNMIVEDERDAVGLQDLWEGEAIVAYSVSRPSSQRPRSVNELASLIMSIEDTQKYFKLRNDVVDHLWELHAHDN